MDAAAAARPQYNDVDAITTSPEVAALPELMWLGCYPQDAPAYHTFVVENSVRLSVQLQVPNRHCPSYHATAAGEVIRVVFPAGDAAELHLRSVDLLDLGGEVEATTRVYVVHPSAGEPWTWTALCVCWPDFGVLSPAALHALLREWDRRVVAAAAEAAPGNKINTHVHCRAGIGRSGTFALARALWRSPPRGGAAAWSLAAASGVLAEMRESRPGLVETDAQLAGATNAANALRGCCGGGAIPGSDPRV